MRRLLVVAMLFSLLGAAASPMRAGRPAKSAARPAGSGAGWLILVGGKKIATEGPWSLKGDLLTVHETSGRILTVATNTVDAAACLKANAGALHVQVVPTAPAAGSPLTKPRIDAAPSAGPGPRNPATVPGRTALPNSPGAPASGTPAAEAKAKTPEERAAAQKLEARQAQLLRDQRYRQIVDGCARMYVVDKAGFDRCVQTQTQTQTKAP